MARSDGLSRHEVAMVLEKVAEQRYRKQLPDDEDSTFWLEVLCAITDFDGEGNLINFLCWRGYLAVRMYRRKERYVRRNEIISENLPEPRKMAPRDRHELHLQLADYLEGKYRKIYEYLTGLDTSVCDHCPMSCKGQIKHGCDHYEQMISSILEISHASYQQYRKDLVRALGRIVGTCPPERVHLDLPGELAWDTTDRQHEQRTSTKWQDAPCSSQQN